MIAGGASLDRARYAVVMAHGRGGGARDMMGLAEGIGIPDIAYLAPEAKGRSWWPDSFLAPFARNEPKLGMALAAMEASVGEAMAGGMAPERIVVTGFSQGACLALEHAARAGRPYRAVAALSGGLVGTGEAGGAPRADLYGHTAKSFDYAGRLDGTRAMIGCHAQDPHIPLARVRESAAVLEAMGAEVTTYIHPGAGHGVTEKEVSWLRGVLNAPAP